MITTASASRRVAEEQRADVRVTPGVGSTFPRAFRAEHGCESTAGREGYLTHRVDRSVA